MTHVGIWLPAVAWAALIFVLSAQPDLRVVPDHALLDLVVRKLGHFMAFGVLALLLWHALRGTPPLSRQPWAGAAILTILYAVTDEAHQGFVAGRHTSATDVGIDALGALTFLLAARIISSR